MKLIKILVLFTFGFVYTIAKPIEINSNVANKEVLDENQLTNSERSMDERKRSVPVEHNKCHEVYGETIESRNHFVEELMYDYLISGDTETLDKILNNMVAHKCFSERSVLKLRNRLLNLYNIVHTQQFDNTEFNAEDLNLNVANMLDQNLRKRSDFMTEKQLAYFQELSAMVTGLIDETKDGNTDSVDMLKYMVEHLAEIAATKDITKDQERILSDRIIERLVELNQHHQQNEQIQSAMLNTVPTD